MALDVHRVSVPVLLCEKTGQGHRIEGEVLGTAWYVGGGFFKTAGHVVEAMRAARTGLVAGLVFKIDDSGATAFGEIHDTEILEGDIAILHSDRALAERYVTALTWWLEPVNQMEEVWSAGYAYGLHRGDDNVIFTVRAFKGNVVGGIKRLRVPGATSGPGDVYELSFQVPRGLSGSPLLMEVAHRARIIGVVIGNSSSKMLVHESTEVDADGAKTLIVERYESLSLGIATQATFIAGLESKLLQGRVVEHLAKHRLIAGTVL